MGLNKSYQNRLTYVLTIKAGRRNVLAARGPRNSSNSSTISIALVLASIECCSQIVSSAIQGNSRYRDISIFRELGKKERQNNKTNLKTVLDD